MEAAKGTLLVTDESNGPSKEWIMNRFHRLRFPCVSPAIYDFGEGLRSSLVYGCL